MKKKIAIGLTILGLLVVGSQTYASFSKYDAVKSDLTKENKVDPDGKSLPPIVFYKANQNAQTKLKDVSELVGHVSDEKLAEKGGQYTLKKLMTYREYFDLGIDQGFRHDIDPERMVWVVSSKFSKTHMINGKPVEKANVTALYDAETGEQLSITVSSDDPNGLDQLKTKNN